MKPSESQSNIEMRNSEIVYAQVNRAQYNNTAQSQYASPQKAYPQRSHTLDDNEIIGTDRTSGLNHVESQPSPLRMKGVDPNAHQYLTETYDGSTKDLTRISNYQSSSRMRMNKKSVEPISSGAHKISATISSNKDPDLLPQVKGA